jgi:integrase
MRAKLTDTFLKKSLKDLPKTGRKIVWDTELPCFGLQVMASGVRSFICQYRACDAAGTRGKSRRMKLGGSMNAAGLEQARNEARAILGRISGAKATGQSADPLGERQAQEARNRAIRQANADAGRFTMRALFNAYTRSKAFRAQRKHENVAAGIALHLVPRLGGVAVYELTRHQISEAIDDIAAKVGPGAAIAAFSRLRATLNWYAAAKKTAIPDLPGNDNFTVPIVKGMAPSKGKPRERTLTDDEIRKLWGAANDAGQFGRLVKFLLLTGMRRDEARLMTRAELGENQVEIPAERYKTGKTFVAPLSAQAKVILAEIPANDWDLVFHGPNGKGLDYHILKGKLDKAARVTGYTLHDLRRTARSLMSRIGVQADVGERCLGHVVGGIRGVYDKHSYYREKLAAYEALAAEIDRINGANIVRFPAAAG